MRVLVTGSRDWDDAYQIEAALEQAWVERGRPPITQITVVHGGARGADQIAGAVARRLGMQEQVFPAQWSTYGKRAGFVRNAEMVDTKPDLCLAFIRGESKGATMTAVLAEAAGVPTMRFTR